MLYLDIFSLHISSSCRTCRNACTLIDRDEVWLEDKTAI
jgi:hypothetical protein